MQSSDRPPDPKAPPGGEIPLAGEGRRRKPWGGRFHENQAPLFERLNASLPYDYVLAPYDLRGSRAHVRMLGSVGVLAPDEVGDLLAGLDQVEEEMKAGAFPWDLGDEDVHMAIERRLTDIVGSLGGKVHTGRSRNDQVVLDVQLYLRDAVRGHLGRVLDLVSALLQAAERSTGVVLPGYTHLQRAQPVLLAHHFLAYVSMLERDAGRLERWFESSWMPLGAGALAGVNYPLDREMVARELGFEKVAPNAMDAVASRDAAFEYLSVATGCALHLSRLAEELVLWSSQEFGFITLPDTWTSGSSIMPQKKNPDGAELVRGKAAGFLGRLTALGALVKGLPLAYNKDLQEDKLYLFATRDELDLCLESMSAMVATLAIDEDRARVAAEGGYAQATDVADYLVARGLPFREAHHITGRLVALVAGQGRPLASVTLDELRSLCPLFDSTYYQVVDLDKVVAGKISPGGTAPRRVAEQLSDAFDWLTTTRSRVQEAGPGAGPDA
ncbi:MAG: argininosuccinate lyase [Thermoleophilia bacterium]|nr:argininosuccinate lyase [Thermoleophilia bacterium]